MFWPKIQEDLNDGGADRLERTCELPFVSFLPYGPKQGTRALPFPPGHQGFFYYHKQHLSPYSGQLRFRLASNSDPGSWAAGSDFTLPNGLPWNKNIFAIATQHPQLTAVRDLLLAEGLITLELVKRCQKVVDWRRSLGPNILMTDLGQPFAVGFQAFDRGQFAVVGCEEYKFVRVDAFFRDLRGSSMSPYQGSAICQFEQYIPRSSRRARPITDDVIPRKIALRVLKIIEPVSCIKHDYDGYMNMPREGQLMAMGHGDARRVWSYDVDTGEMEHRAMGRLTRPQDDPTGLKLLFDYERPASQES